MVVGTADQALGRIDMPLSIEPWDGKTFSVSGITLSHDAHPAADLTAGLDDALLEGTHPLIAKGLEIVPTGTSQFNTGERGFFYFEIYRPDPAVATIPMRVRVRATGAMKTDSGPIDAATYVHPGKSTVPVGLVIPVAGLTPGAYRLELAVSPGSGQEPVTRTSDFDVN